MVKSDFGEWSHDLDSMEAEARNLLLHRNSATLKPCLVTGPYA